MLTLDRLQVRYGEVVAVRDVSVEIRRGEIVAVVGANGAGKTSMLKAISGLLKPAAGRVRFGDVDIGGWPPHRVTRQGIVHVPEGRLLVEEMTVRENLLTGAYARNDRGAILDDLERIQRRFPILLERANQKTRTLSGGERQMLALGRALMARPKLLMLDEPSLGLAPLIVEEVLRTIEELRREGATILLVEQNAYRAIAIADRAYVLRVGSVMLHDRAGALLKNRDLLDAYLGEV